VSCKLLVMGLNDLVSLQVVPNGGEFCFNVKCEDWLDDDNNKGLLASL
jgi:hypothetical protein